MYKIPIEIDKLLQQNLVSRAGSYPKIIHRKKNIVIKVSSYVIEALKKE